MWVDQWRTCWERLRSVRLLESRRSRVCLRAVVEGLAAVAVVAGLGVGFTPESSAALDLLERRAVEPVAGAPDTWLVMLYADAEDQLLEEDIVFSVNEAESVGSTEQVKIVAQLDRCVGSDEEDGGTVVTQRFLLEKDDDLQTLASEVSGYLGELSMGDPQTLYDFVAWAVSKYPSEHYVLLLSDHGSGWYGGWYDDEPDEGDWLSMPELDAALAAVVADAGIDAFELVGFDACLMSEVEVMSALAPHARYAVASEEVSTSLGFSYASLLQQLTDDPAMTGAELGKVMVESFIEQKARLLDDDARESWTGGDYTAQEAIDNLLRDCTLAAIDLGKMTEVNAALNRLAVALASLDQGLVAKARTYAQSYESLYGSPSANKPGPPSVVDLGSLVDMLLALTDDPEVTVAGVEVKEALDEAVVAERHGSERPGSAGMAVYFPLSEEYEWAFCDEDDSYPRSVARFAAASLWDDYLTYHFAGRPIDSKAFDLSVLTAGQAANHDFSDATGRSVLAVDDKVVAPGAGGVKLSDPIASRSRVNSRETVTLSTEVTGANVAEVYYYVARYVEEQDSYLCAEAGYIDCPTTEEVGGLGLAHWGKDSPVSVEFEWLPVLHYLSGGDDERDVLAFVQPGYLSSASPGASYTVMGSYQFFNTGEAVYAQIEFDGRGELLGIWGYCPSAWFDVEYWHEILPVRGDVFSVANEFVDYGNGLGSEPVDYEGDVFVFGEDSLRLVAQDAEPGEYALCIGIEDMDGNLLWDYASVTVTE